MFHEHILEGLVMLTPRSTSLFATNKRTKKALKKRVIDYVTCEKFLDS